MKPMQLTITEYYKKQTKCDTIPYTKRENYKIGGQYLAI
jgi:hypothetical protein